MTRSSPFSLLFGLMLMSASIGFAQITSTIVGVVTDPAGAVLPGATLTAESDRGPVSVTTDQAGRYRLTGLPAATYTITVELAGFATFTRSGVVLPLNRTITVDIQMELATVEESVTVVADAAMVQTKKSDLAVGIDNTTIDNIPLKGRQFLDLLTLVPGVSTRPPSSDQGSSITVFGERSITNSFLIDGHDNNDLFERNFSEFFIQDAIQEFQVYLAGFPAEFGRASGAIANVVTRSGTNDLAGRFFLFHRNDALNSSNIEGQDPQPLNRFEAGGTIGGPIRTDKTFFFDALQFLREERGLNFDQSVLAPAVLTGYFSPAVGGVEPFDALPLDKKFTNFFKLNHQFNSQNQLFVSVNINRGTSDNFLAPPDRAFNSPPPGTINLPSVSSDVENNSSSVNGRYTTFFSTAAFLESSLRWSKSTYQENVDNPPEAESMFPITFVPNFQIWQSNAPNVGIFDRTQERIQWTENLSYFADTGSGTHSLKFGVDLDHVKLDQLFLPPVGIILGNSALDTRTDELGYDITMQRFFAPILSPNERAQVSTNNASVFVQDSWEPKPGLTLNLGVRYDYASLFGDDKNNVAPRLGFAWDIRDNQQTVLRAGFGRFYDQTILEAAVLTPELGGIQLGTMDFQVIPRGGSFFNNPFIGAYGPLQDSGTRWLSNPKFYSYLLPEGDFRSSGGISITGLGQPYIIYDLLGIPVTDPATPPVLRYDTISSLTGGRLTPEEALAILNDFFPGPDGAQFSFLEETGSSSINTGRPLIFLFRQLEPSIDSIQTIERPHQTPYTDSFNVGIEQALGPDFALDAELFIRRGRKLLARRVINLVDNPVAATCSGNTTDRGPCNRQLQYIGFLNTEAFTLALKKRYRQNYSLLASYTYTHAVDNFSTYRVPPRGNETSFLFNNRPEEDEGRSLNTPAHVFVLSGVYTMPYEFDLSGVLRYNSGRPFNAAGLPQDSDGDTHFDNRLIGTEKGEFLTDYFIQLDLRLAKRFVFEGRTQMSFLFEVFNLFNRANPYVVNRQFGPELGEIIEPFPGREIQLGFRFEF